MMTTTIQISDKVKDKIFRVINKLEAKLNHRVTYDEALDFILSKEEAEKKMDKEKFVDKIRRLKGSLSDDAKEYYNEGRKIDLARENRFFSD